MKYTFNFVDMFDADMFSKNYEFDNLKEAEQHAKRLLAEDMNSAVCVEITSEDYSVVRHKVNK